ncbi:MAG: DUF1648 domain-containing protein [Clostridia bacterium]|nr:DUF1648 domain-containing protein [Clostridia bacterium]
MIRKNNWTLIITSVIILLPILAGLLLWNRLPEQVPTHWGVDGAADGWSSRAVAVFLMPALLLVFHWICIGITAADPGNRNQTPKAFGNILKHIHVPHLARRCLCLEGGRNERISPKAEFPKIAHRLSRRMKQNCRKQTRLGIHRAKDKHRTSGSLKQQLPCAKYTAILLEKFDLLGRQQLKKAPLLEKRRIGSDARDDPAACIKHYNIIRISARHLGSLVL